MYEYTYTGSNNRALTFSLHLHHFKHFSLCSAQCEQTPVGQLQVTLIVKQRPSLKLVAPAGGRVGAGLLTLLRCPAPGAADLMDHRY